MEHIDLPTGRDQAKIMYPLAIRAGGMERAGARKIRKFPNLPRLVQGCFGVSSGCTRTRKRPLRHPWTSPAPIIHCSPPLFSGEAQGCVDAGDKSRKYEKSRFFRDCSWSSAGSLGLLGTPVRHRKRIPDNLCVRESAIN